MKDAIKRNLGVKNTDLNILNLRNLLNILTTKSIMAKVSKIIQKCIIFCVDEGKVWCYYMNIYKGGLCYEQNKVMLFYSKHYTCVYNC